MSALKRPSMDQKAISSWFSVRRTSCVPSLLEGSAFAALSIALMEKLKIRPGDPVVVASSSQSKDTKNCVFLCTGWPSDSTMAASKTMGIDFDGSVQLNGARLAQLKVPDTPRSRPGLCHVRGCGRRRVATRITVSSGSQGDKDAKNIAPASIRRILGRRYVMSGSVVRIPTGAPDIQIVSCTPPGPVLVTRHTVIRIGAPSQPNAEKINSKRVRRLGASLRFVRELCELVDLATTNPPAAWRGYSPPPIRGVLLHGPPGCGKTMAVRMLCETTGSALVSVEPSVVFGGNVGQAEARLRDAFREAETIRNKTGRPVVVFLDEIDALCPARTREGSQSASRVVAQLLTLMDGHQAPRGVIIIGATNRPNSLDRALRRPGRFDREITVSQPDATERAALLRHYLERIPGLQGAAAEKLSLEAAAFTNGFVAAGIAAVCRRAAQFAAESERDALQSSEKAANDAEKLTTDISALVGRCLKRAAEAVGSASMRQHRSQSKRPRASRPSVRWTNIGGLNELKSALKNAVSWPLEHPNQLKKLGLTPPRGILLYGPPGCGKTTLARAMASGSQASFISADAATILSSLLGQAEKNLRGIFRAARANRPCVLFIDEIDGLVSRRDASAAGGGSGTGVGDRLLATLLTEMDGIDKCEGVLVVAATNRPRALDAALLRPGRFDQCFYVPPPDLAAVRAILKVHTREMKLDPAGLDMDGLARRLVGFTGADVENICREAAMLSLRRCLRGTGNVLNAFVSQTDFESARKLRAPSVSADEIAMYQTFRAGG